MKKKIIPVLIITSFASAIGYWFFFHKKDRKDEFYREVSVSSQSIRSLVRSSGSVHPRNRLEIRPPISGRIDKIMVNEGDFARKGALLAWMSSTERAALLDAARARSAAELKEWEDFYKPTPVFSPLQGRVIAANIRPGQTVTAQDALFVLSDDLIVRAQVDETDLARIRKGLKVTVVIDSYPGFEISSRVTHIAYEAITVNNVTIYEVEVSPDTTPEFMRSGMSATVDFIAAEAENIPALPQDAVFYDENGTPFVYSRFEGEKKPQRREIQTGISDDRYIEIRESLNVGDIVLIPERGGKPKPGQSNPFSTPRTPRR